MPAVVPLVMAAGSAVVGGIAAHKKNQAAKKAQAEQQRVVNENAQAFKTWQSALADNPELKAALFSPRTTSTSMSGRTVSDIDEMTSPEYLQPGQQAMANMLTRKYTNLINGPQVTPGTEESIVAKAAAVGRGQEEALRNLGASRGIDPALMATIRATGPQAALGAAAAQARLDVENMGRANLTNALGMGSAWLAKNQSQHRTGHDVTSSNQSQTTTGPADVGQILNWYGMQAPQATQYVPQAITEDPLLAGLQGGIGGYSAGRSFFPPSASAPKKASPQPMDMSTFLSAYNQPGGLFPNGVTF